MKKLIFCVAAVFGVFSFQSHANTTILDESIRVFNIDIRKIKDDIEKMRNTFNMILSREAEKQRALKNKLTECKRENARNRSR